MSADSFERELEKVLAGIAASQSALASCMVWWETVHRDGRGGGEDRATAGSRAVLEEGMQARIRRIDPYCSPAVSLPAHQRADGKWCGAIRWFGLGD